jgi:cupin superfamily acireductone dioxygenase involved in methionine salvage
VDRGHRLGKLLFAIHPHAYLLSSVRVHNSDLILIAVVVRHMFSPLALRMVSGFLEEFQNSKHQER